MGLDDLSRWRGEFPILERTTYMISNSLGAMPRGAAASLAEYVETWATRGVRAWEERWWEMPREIGDRVAAIIGAPAGSVSMHENVTSAVTSALSAVRPEPRRNRLVCLAADFPSTIYLYRAQQQAGFELVIVPAEADFTVRTERIIERIDERTAFVSLSHVLFKTSFIVDPAPVIERAHQVGARVLVDGYQSAGIIPVDVTALGVDYFTGGCLKWLCGGPGAAFLYTHPDVRRQSPPRVTGWVGHRSPFAFDIDALDYRDDAMAMMTGTPSIPAYYAALPGLEIVSAVGVDRIRAHSKDMTALALARADEYGLPSISPRDPERLAGTIAINPPDALQVSRALKAREFLVDYRPGVGIRISPHFYNTADEVDAVLAEARRIADARDYDTGGPRSLVT